MPTEKGASAQEKALIEELFRAKNDDLLRYAEILLKKHGSGHISISGRAEDVVQDVFYLAVEKYNEMQKSGSPVGWLYAAVYHKVQEAVREDRTWFKRLTLIEVEPKSEDFCKLPLEWEGLMTQKDYELLRKLYLEGYSYKELCAELGVKKSTLAMRVKRIKARFQKNYKEI